MSEIKTMPIGERFECENVMLEVVYSPNFFCDGCYWQNRGRSCDLLGYVVGCGACDQGARSDGKNVIFKEVESSK